MQQEVLSFLSTMILLAAFIN